MITIPRCWIWGLSWMHSLWRISSHCSVCHLKRLTKMKQSSDSSQHSSLMHSWLPQFRQWLKFLFVCYFWYVRAQNPVNNKTFVISCTVTVVHTTLVILTHSFFSAAVIMANPPAAAICSFSSSSPQSSMRSFSLSLPSSRYLCWTCPDKIKHFSLFSRSASTLESSLDKGLIPVSATKCSSSPLYSSQGCTCTL